MKWLMVLFMTTAFSMKFYVFVDVLNLRACPSLECDVIGSYRFMDEFEALDIVYTNGFDWIRTENGYVALQFVDTVPFPASSITICFDPNASTHPIPPDYVPRDLVEIPKGLSLREGLKLRAEALDALLRMIETAKRDGMNLKVISAYRDWYYQRNLYLKAIERYGPDQRWVAKPGRSEHQLGVAVDLVGADISLALDPNFKGTREYEWLVENSRRFGFYQSYPPENPFYEEEPWHFRYSPCSPYPSAGR